MTLIDAVCPLLTTRNSLPLLRYLSKSVSVAALSTGSTQVRAAAGVFNGMIPRAISLTS